MTTYRILRDTKLARRVKAACENKCQICGETLILPDGTAYSEAHHIKPLGGDHKGPDDEGNLICLCPNHHAALDFGALKIERGQLLGTHKDKIETKYVDYHNKQIFGKSPQRANLRENSH